jgi:hypothetical protein
MGSFCLTTAVRNSSFSSVLSEQAVLPSFSSVLEKYFRRIKPRFDKHLVSA